MKLYAETPGLRTRQLVGDLAVLAWMAAWVAAGVALYRLVEKLAVPGERVEQAGSSFAGDIAEIQQKVGRLPVVGGELQDPFGRLAGVGRTLAAAGVTSVVIPRTGKPSAARAAIEHADTFVDAVKWRTGSEGRISHLKRDWAWRRTRLRGHTGARLWCAHGVFAHNVVKLIQLQR